MLSFNINQPSSILNAQGEENDPSNPQCSIKTAYESYENILKLRHFDALAFQLHRIGKMGTFPSMLGQEAIPIATAKILEDNDIIAPYYRDHGLIMARGLPPENILLFWSGHKSKTHTRNDFPICIPIGTQCPHAVGAAYALKLNHTPQIVLASIGDGGTARGDFYESMHAADRYQLPMIFLINNNQWAISTPYARHTTSKSLAQKGLATNMRCYQVDGNDVFSLMATLKEARQYALEGKPCLIEALTYRLPDHTTVDDATQYRCTKETAEAFKFEPLIRLRHYIQKQAPDNHDLAVIEQRARIFQETCLQAFEQAKILQTPMLKEYVDA